MNSISITYTLVETVNGASNVVNSSATLIHWWGQCREFYRPHLYIGGDSVVNSIGNTFTLSKILV